MGTSTLAISPGATEGFCGGIVLIGSLGVSPAGLAVSTGFGAAAGTGTDGVTARGGSEEVGLAVSTGFGGAGNTDGIRAGSAGAGAGETFSTASFGITLPAGGISSLFAWTSGFETAGGVSLGGDSRRAGAITAASLFTGSLAIFSATRIGSADLGTTGGETLSFAASSRKAGAKATTSFFGGSLTISFAIRTDSSGFETGGMKTLGGASFKGADGGTI